MDVVAAFARRHDLRRRGVGAEALQQLVDAVISGQRARIAETASLPFWIDSWITDMDSLRAKFNLAPPESEPRATNLVVRLYPVAHLDALRPEIWEQLKTADPAWLTDLYVAAIALELDGRPESGLLLLRRVDGQLKLAGMVEE
jgi:hypothetical protein